jgi:A/G-specific adenine glycosylase
MQEAHPFTRTLLHWHQTANHRSMPWKGPKDPYKIWLSEIILQQTRVEQGLPYYNRFIQHFPTVTALAQAPDDIVFRLWQGLGYYARCKNMLRTARLLTTNFQGQFPTTLEGLKALPGVGPYTAAAIASFAYDLPHAVVDGNVFRVLTRYFGISSPIDTPLGKHEITELSDKLISKNQPAYYNQAIMDFGALICKPQNPLCSECPLSNTCEAYTRDLIHLLPIKKNKTKIRNRYLDYYLFQQNNFLFIRKRLEKDIWAQLHDYYLIEQTDEQVLSQNTQLESLPLAPEIHKLEPSSLLYKQKLSHQHITVRFTLVQVSEKFTLPEPYFKIDCRDLESYAFPKIIHEYHLATFNTQDSK